ncbi:MAG: IS256 family transposase [Actinobacteria bacterium]|nr:IS256 family transposase [Actinomycetota bacterium]
MSSRVAPSVALEAAIEELMAEGLTDPDRLAELGRLGARLVMQRAVDEEVAAFLGRARYQRTAEARGSRNGVRPRRLQTGEGELEIQMPQVRNAGVAFVSEVIPDVRAVIRTRPLESLIIGAYIRGLSDRDIEGLLQEAGLGHVSKSGVSRICQELRDRYRAFRAQSLAEVKLLVMFLDAIYMPTRPSGAKEGVLVAWGYTEQGDRVLLDVSLGQREHHEDWLEMGRGLTRRGLGAPALAVIDGAPGLIKAVEELWPASDRQRCTVHRLRNVLAKLPKRQDLHERVRAAYWAALDDASSDQDAEARLRVLVGELEREYPSAAARLAEDLPALCVHLRYPLRLRKRLRSTNLLERSLGEVRRRTKVIGRFPGESSCLSLIWATLDLFIAGARGLGPNPFERQQLAQLRAVRLAPPPKQMSA